MIIETRFKYFNCIFTTDMIKPNSLFAVARNLSGDIMIFADKPVRLGIYWRSSKYIALDKIFKSQHEKINPNAFKGISWENSLRFYLRKNEEFAEEISEKEFDTLSFIYEQ